jgi:2-(1,2-epoxy-1,2-dihydrophenyl)acetyl-CoA isomerase
MSTLSYEVTEGVAEITLSRPEVLNALDAELIAGLTKAAANAATDPAVRAVLLTGAGKGFCAGADLKWLMAETGGEPSPELQGMFWQLAGQMHDGIATLKRMPKPVIAAVNGPAAGAGVGYALACDMVWASSEATFRLAYTGVGLAPDGGTTGLVTRLVGEKRAFELFYSAEKVSAAEAERLGLVTRVLAPDELLPQARAAARKLAQGPSLALGLAKGLINDALREGLETQMEREREAIARTAGSADFAEGVRAFVEKRPPRFTGA